MTERRTPAERCCSPLHNGPAVPVLRINDHATGGRRTKDILGGPKGWGPKKKVANVEIYVIFEVFAFCGGRTKTDFKDRGRGGQGRSKYGTFGSLQWDLVLQPWLLQHYTGTSGLRVEIMVTSLALSLKSVLVLPPQKAKTSKIT